MKALWRALSLSTLVVQLSCASLPWSPFDSEARTEARISEAVERVWVDDLPGAQKRISDVLEDAPGNPAALVVQACLFLEQGDLEAATRTVARLDAVAPRQPETHILQELLEERRRTPVPGWSESMRRAWVDAGAPDLEKEGLATNLTPRTLPLSPTVWENTRSAEERFVAMLADGGTEDQERWLADHLSELQDRGLMFSALEYFQPREDRPPEVRARARQVLRKRLAPLAAVETRESELPLMLLLVDTSLEAPLTQEEMAALERLASLPLYTGTPMSQLYADAERRLRASGVTHPGAGPFMAAVMSIHTAAPFWLLKRVDVTKDRLSAEERMRLGRSVWTLGGRVASGPTLLEHQLGFRLMEQGAELMGDEAQRALAASELRQGEAIRTASNQILITRWPLPSLFREWMKESVAHEWEHLGRLVEP
ncbi:hypothetical protein D7X74_33080 [Corallococcus sp. CA047B]|uniref:hypothetical protein n=1 Tax=Corallococcus sp. CA047B TaxID=2316729 RepID=UPI000EA203F7|nr:hypothetical protein [Corallococcus sp. CA047B]RKH07322.1 hypothetical protein D7X74_33080 [Corallococcus sp. CA047B]